MIAVSSPLFHGYKQRLIAAAAEYRLPAMYEQATSPRMEGCCPTGRTFAPSSAVGFVRRQNRRRSQARRLAVGAADEARANHQPQDGQRARSHDPTYAPRPCRRGDRMRRRDFFKVTAGSLVSWPLRANAQQRMLRIGVLWPGASPPAPPRMESFRQTLNLLGFVEGQNVEIDLQYAKEGLRQIPNLASDLARRKVDVILTFGDFAPRVVREATQQTPIVVISDDLLGAGLVSSLSAPVAISPV